MGQSNTYFSKSVAVRADVSLISLVVILKEIVVILNCQLAAF